MALTTQERTSLLKLTVAMFNATPGATYLAELGANYEANGRSMANLARDLSGTGAYKSINPDSQTALTFAAAFLTPFGLQANAEALAFVTTRFAAGAAKGTIAHEAAVALDASTAPAFAAAKAILVNKTTVSEAYANTLAIGGTHLPVLQQAIASVTSDSASVNPAIAAFTTVSVNLSAASDVYVAGSGYISINGFGGDDNITSTAGGNNIITTLTGNDAITTGDGNDTLNAGDGDNIVIAGGGNNVVTTSSGNDTVTGGAHADTIVTGAGNDIINAGAGTDSLASGAGNDTIALGADTVTDIVIFGGTPVANGNDVITNFVSGTDKLNVDATTAQLAPIAVAGALTVTPGAFYFLGTSAAGNADSTAAAAAVLQAAATWTNGAIGDFAFFAISDNNSSAIYHYLEAGGAGITAAELTLMGTVDAKIVSGDLTFA